MGYSKGEQIALGIILVVSIIIFFAVVILCTLIYAIEKSKNGGHDIFYEEPTIEQRVARGVRDGIMKARMEEGKDTRHWGDSDWD